MIKQLYIAEKPSLAREIAAQIGVTKKNNGWLACKNDIAVTWAVGHLFTLNDPDAYDPNLKRWQISTLPFIPEVFTRKVSDPKRQPQIKIIENLLKQSESVVNAGDPDREGQVIIDEILDELNYTGKTDRIWIKALNDKMLQEAIGGLRPNSEFKGLSDSAIGRSHADWIVGMNYTRAYTLLARQKGHEGVFSVGRVQTPTLAMVVRRDLEIENFKKTEHYSVDAHFKVENGAYKGVWQIPKSKCDLEGRCITKDHAEELKTALTGQESKIKKITSTKKQTLAELPFSLSSLQVYCSKKHGFGAKEVLDLAQALYETHKAITYPRTDCTYLEENDFGKVKETLNAVSAEELDVMHPFMEHCNTDKAPRCFNSKKVTAHTAIVPTNEKSDLSRMSKNERLVYDAVRRRYVAQFMPPYTYQSTTIDTLCVDELFRSKGNVLLEEGWRMILGSDNKKDTLLPKVEKGELGTCTDAAISIKFTKPPARYTEGLLIADMENIAKYVENSDAKKVLKSQDVKGIGTEATRANIIETLKHRSYLITQGKNLISTDKAREFLSVLPAELKDPVTTANWETMLSEMAENRLTLKSFEEQISAWVRKEIGQLKTNPVNNIPEAKRDFVRCPDCGREVKRYQGKKNFFWGCLGYGDEANPCRNLYPDADGKPKLDEKFPQLSDKFKCEKCQAPLVRRPSKKNKNVFWWGCSGFKNGCKQTYFDKAGEPKYEQKPTILSDKFKCEKCEAPLARLPSQNNKGAFWWGCSGFKNGCKETYFDDNGAPKYKNITVNPDVPK